MTFPRTDLGNAERLVARHGDDLRFVPGMGWLAWDGKRWQRDETGAAMRCMKQTARSIYTEAADAADADATALGKWAVTSESEPRLRAALALAQSEAALVVGAADLDANPYQLNVENGTIDLRTGEIEEHRGSDLITRLAPVEYDPEAIQSRWLQFLDRVTGGDPELLAFLQRSIGYSATGFTNEEVLFMPHGPTASGKSTAMETIKATLGDYAATADFETFLHQNGDGGVRSDIARLAGVRLVLGIEVDEGRRLAEGLLKQLTGGDTVTTRFMYREFFEFRPTFKLWLVANHRPRVSASDDAIWRRILQVPFTEAIPEYERDRKLKQRLIHEDRAGVLAWIVAGASAWLEDGLTVPKSVRDYTDNYRAENDPLGEWLASCCRLTAGTMTTAHDLRTSYEGWAERVAEKTVGPRAFAASLEGHGCQKHRGTAGKRHWKGVELVTHEDVTSSLLPHTPVHVEVHQ